MTGVGLYAHGSSIVDGSNQGWISGTPETDSVAVWADRFGFGRSFGIRMLPTLEADLASLERRHAIQREGDRKGVEGT